MTTIPTPEVTILERKHAGKGITFAFSGDPFYVETCCTLSTVDVVDQDKRQCVTHCPQHGSVRRQYDHVMTNEEKARINDLIFGTGTGFNPPSDPDGDHQQRTRKGGYSTFRWHEARR
jgi:hypothetical protein